jgi:hypothetical protein
LPISIHPHIKPAERIQTKPFEVTPLPPPAKGLQCIKSRLFRLHHRRVLGKQLLDKLLSPGAPPTIIVLQADHDSDSNTYHDQSSKTDRFERFGKLMAVCPENPFGLQLPQNLTPVNLSGYC